MGKYQIDAALNIAVSSEAQSAVSDLGALIKQQSDAQIQQNKLIAQVLKEVTDARKKDVVVQKEEVVRTRDNTKQMNALAAAAYKLRSGLYNNIGVIRNLGEMVTKTLTVWLPWYNMIMMVVDAVKQGSEWLGIAKTEVDNLNDSMSKTGKIEPPDWSKWKPDVKLQYTTDDVKTLQKKWGPYYTKEQEQSIPVEEELRTANEELDNIKQTQEGIDKKSSAIVLKLIQYKQEYTELNDLLTQHNEQLVDGIEVYDEEERNWEDIEKRVKELKPLITDLQRDAEKFSKSLQPDIDYWRQYFQYLADNYQAILSGSGYKKKEKDTKTPGKKAAEDFIKREEDDFRVFIEYFEKSAAPNQGKWYQQIFAALDDIQKQIPKYIHTDIGREFARSWILDGFDNYWNKAIEERRTEYKKMLDKVFPPEDTYLKDRLAALEKPLKYIKDKTDHEMGFNWMPLTHISSEDKANIEKQIQENADWYQDRMATISQERAKKLENLESRRKEFEAFDVAGLGISPEERLAQLQKFQDEELQIKLDALNEEERVKQEYANRDKNRRKAEVEAFGNMFRIIDKNSEAWKKSDEAMNTMITAVDTLGFSEKKVFALQNYAKGIEASVDAINCQADAIIKFGLGDIKGGIALQAAAVSKGMAAYAYFKNSMEMGGKGGSAPSVGTAAVTGTDVKERDITINMAFEGTAGAIIRPLADAFNQQATVPGGVRLNSRLVRA